MAHIKVIDYESSDGRLREVYDQLISKRGKLAQVHSIQSLRPESILKHMDLYLEIMYSSSELSRPEREMIAVIVSVTNGCLYCQAHHAEALNHYWKDTERIEILKTDYMTAHLSAKEIALCLFAIRLTKDPSDHEANDYTPMLRQAGLSDSAILDAVLVIAYFNFVNRIVLSLGLKTSLDEVSNYNY